MKRSEPLKTQQENVSGRGNGKCKGPGARGSAVCSRSGKIAVCLLVKAEAGESTEAGGVPSVLSTAGMTQTSAFTLIQKGKQMEC